MENQTVQTTKASIKGEWLFLIILLIPFLYIPFIWDKLPDSIATHWNFKFQPDHYSSKIFGTFFLPVLNVVIYLLLLVIPKIDPRKKNYQYFGNSYRIIRLSLALFFMALFYMTIQWSLGNTLISSKALIMLMLGLMAVFGNYMKTIRSNFFIGFRTPWTLDNAEVWRRTHERGGKLWFYASLATFVICFFIREEYLLWLLIPYMAAIILYPVLYSYMLFRKIGRMKTNE